MGFKVERGFARCPVKGCGARRVLYVATDTTTFGLLNESMTSITPAGWRGTPAQQRDFRSHGVYCEKHETGMSIQRLKATRSESPCTDKCLSAVGPNCECECAGKNHGKAATASLS